MSDHHFDNCSVVLRKPVLIFNFQFRFFTYHANTFSLFDCGCIAVVVSYLLCCCAFSDFHMFKFFYMPGKFFSENLGLLRNLAKLTKNLTLGLILARFGPNLVPKTFFVGFISTRCLDVRHCIRLSLYRVSRKNNKPNLRNWQKIQLRAWFWPLAQT